MQKVDVGVCSYKKPESLIYTVLSLKKHCGDLIDTIYINDDCSNDGTIDYYKDENFIKAVAPIKIKVRENKTNMEYNKKIYTPNVLPEGIEQVLGVAGNYAILTDDENNIRYQWAINSTDKKYLLLIHDDVKFLDDILSFYLAVIQRNENCAIVGQLGQCWICEDGDKCSPSHIIKGKRPHQYWPLTSSPEGELPGFYRRDCRINEWCCLLNVDIARKVSKEKRCYYGNYGDFLAQGDIGAYWFGNMVEMGYEFDDPLQIIVDQNDFYLHCWQGHSGHAVWVDQGIGKAVYKREFLRECLKNEFNYEISSHLSVPVTD